MQHHFTRDDIAEAVTAMSEPVLVPAPDEPAPAPEPEPPTLLDIMKAATEAIRTRTAIGNIIAGKMHLMNAALADNDRTRYDEIQDSLQADRARYEEAQKKCDELNAAEEARLVADAASRFASAFTTALAEIGEPDLPEWPEYGTGAFPAADLAATLGKALYLLDDADPRFTDRDRKNLFAIRYWPNLLLGRN